VGVAVPVSPRGIGQKLVIGTNSRAKSRHRNHFSPFRNEDLMDSHITWHERCQGTVIMTTPPKRIGEWRVGQSDSSFASNPPKAIGRGRGGSVRHETLPLGSNMPPTAPLRTSRWAMGLRRVGVSIRGSSPRSCKRVRFSPSVFTIAPAKPLRVPATTAILLV
jgi:hypothetical protein